MVGRRLSSMDYIANIGYVDKKFEGSWSDIYETGYYAYFKDGLLLLAMNLVEKVETFIVESIRVKPLLF
jgi:hypothetical protein